MAFIIEYILLKTYNSNLSQKVNFYLHFSDFSLLFNRLFCSIISLTCIGVSPNSLECKNHIYHYTRDIVQNLISNISEFQVLNISEDIIVEHLNLYFLDFKEFLFTQEQIMAEMLEETTEVLTNDLAEIEDSEFLNFFETNLVHYKITQNFDNNTLILSLK